MDHGNVNDMSITAFHNYIWKKNSLSTCSVESLLTGSLSRIFAIKCSASGDEQWKKSLGEAKRIFFLQSCEYLFLTITGERQHSTLTSSKDDASAPHIHLLIVVLTG
ncbi:hypothetical protein IEQ34_006665 [Dendrobium chrysotoxum]|uniref:Uncharacterized protein n=1 Tax=Dendrobium chrysotoxum TaxID=161865 RepID=A0AAV7H897_DENCH|nr:hypothetical protein IEQ34_006665 [Dendrobium chrysotoxum]